MKEIQLKNKKIWRTGHGYVMTISKKYITDGYIFIDKKYDIILTESKPKE